MSDELGFFQQALSYVLRNEGGATYVNNPSDKGGPTKFGITMATLSHYRKLPVLEVDVKHLSIEEASDIYYAKYWRPNSFHKLKQPAIAIALFDAAVLFGSGVSCLLAQKSLKANGYTIDLDGFIGLKTTAALNAVNPKLFLKDFHGMLSERIDRIETANPVSLVFDKGWRNRIKSYLLLTA